MLDQDEPHVRQLGPGRDRARRALRPAGPGRRRPRACRGRRGGRGPLRRASATRPTRPGPGAGSAATAASSPSTRIARYHLHDVVHHLHDVRGAAAAGHRRGLRRRRGDYSDAAWEPGRRGARPSSTRSRRGRRRGRGCSRSAAAAAATPLALEERGLRVRRTDVTPAFVELLRARATRPTCSTRSPTTSPTDGAGRTTASGPTRPCCTSPAPTCRGARRLAAATRPGGRCAMSLKEGDGEGWSTHGTCGRRGASPTGARSRCARCSTGAGWRVEVDHVDRRRRAALADGGARSPARTARRSG